MLFHYSDYMGLIAPTSLKKRPCTPFFAAHYENSTHPTVARLALTSNRLWDRREKVIEIHSSQTEEESTAEPEQLCLWYEWALLSRSWSLARIREPNVSAHKPFHPNKHLVKLHVGNLEECDAEPLLCCGKMNSNLRTSWVIFFTLLHKQKITNFFWYFGRELLSQKRSKAEMMWINGKIILKFLRFGFNLFNWLSSVKT